MVNVEALKGLVCPDVAAALDTISHHVGDCSRCSHVLAGFAVGMGMSPPGVRLEGTPGVRLEVLPESDRSHLISEVLHEASR